MNPLNDVYICLHVAKQDARAFIQLCRSVPKFARFLRDNLHLTEALFAWHSKIHREMVTRDHFNLFVTTGQYVVLPAVVREVTVTFLGKLHCSFGAAVWREYNSDYGQPSVGFSSYLYGERTGCATFQVGLSDDPDLMFDEQTENLRAERRRLIAPL